MQMVMSESDRDRVKKLRSWVLSRFRSGSDDSVILPDSLYDLLVRYHEGLSDDLGVFDPEFKGLLCCGVKVFKSRRTDWQFPIVSYAVYDYGVQGEP
jgi:hypothetical protein